jgi:hypothetical protein
MRICSRGTNSGGFLDTTLTACLPCLPFSPSPSGGRGSPEPIALPLSTGRRGQGGLCLTSMATEAPFCAILLGKFFHLMRLP